MHESEISRQQQQQQKKNQRRTNKKKTTKIQKKKIICVLHAGCGRFVVHERIPLLSRSSCLACGWYLALPSVTAPDSSHPTLNIRWVAMQKSGQSAELWYAFKTQRNGAQHTNQRCCLKILLFQSILSLFFQFLIQKRAVNTLKYQSLLVYFKLYLFSNHMIVNSIIACGGYNLCIPGRLYAIITVYSLFCILFFLDFIRNNIWFN